MILDVIENAQRYFTLNKGLQRAFEFLVRPDLRELLVGRFEIAGDRVYAMISKGPGRRREGALLESHEKYIDIQLVLAGTDRMGWKPKSSCGQTTGEYDQEGDFQFFADEPNSWVSVGPGTFVIFFPEDAHMPLISDGEIHKIVVKIAV